MDWSFPMLNKQLIFDTVITKLREQGDPSFAHGSCAYQADNGNKCAFGHLMDPTKYDPDFEDNPVAPPIHGQTLMGKHISQRIRDAMRPEFGTFETDDDLVFISDVQRKLHDELADEPNFADCLEVAGMTFARTYKLVFTPA